MIDFKPAETPLVANYGLLIIKGVTLTNKGQYQRIARKIIYLSRSRPYIAYVGIVISRFMHFPFKRKNNHLDVLASWYFMFVKSNSVTLKSKQQKVVALSRAEVGFNRIAKRR